MESLGILFFCLFLVMAFYIIFLLFLRLWKVFLSRESHEILNRPAFYDFDEKRIRKYFEARGFEIENIKHKPFSFGWIGSRNPIYLVMYIDKSGEIKSVLVKTGFFAGVYLSDNEKLNPSHKD